MRANIIKTADPDLALSLSMGGMPDQNAMNYFSNNYSNFVSRAGQLGEAFVSGVQNVYNYFSNSNILNAAKDALINSGMMVGEEVIYYVDENNINNPNMLMKRYIMADPVIYNKYINNRCSGYDDTWYDPEPYIKNPYHRTDYQNVMDGMIQYDKEDNGYINFISTEDGNPLSIIERLTVQKTWDVLANMIAKGIDPTAEDLSEIG